MWSQTKRITNNFSGITIGSINEKCQTEKEILDGEQLIDDLYSRRFTYEWLSKYDPHNSIMGLFVSCCASITSITYGSDVAIVSSNLIVF